MQEWYREHASSGPNVLVSYMKWCNGFVLTVIFKSAMPAKISWFRIWWSFQLYFGLHFFFFLIFFTRFPWKCWHPARLISSRSDDRAYGLKTTTKCRSEIRIKTIIEPARLFGKLEYRVWSLSCMHYAFAFFKWHSYLKNLSHSVKVNRPIPV